MVDDGIKGKIAFVTGAATKMGMGRAIALRLAGAGSHVAILDKYAKPKTNFPGDAGWGGLEEELKEIKAFGVEGLAIEADVASSKDCKEATAKVLEKFGRIDLFVDSRRHPRPGQRPGRRAFRGRLEGANGREPFPALSSFHSP